MNYLLPTTKNCNRIFVCVCYLLLNSSTIEECIDQGGIAAVDIIGPVYHYYYYLGFSLSIFFSLSSSFLLFLLLLRVYGTLEWAIGSAFIPADFNNQKMMRRTGKHREREKAGGSSPLFYSRNCTSIFLIRSCGIIRDSSGFFGILWIQIFHVNIR